jgi:hypothetical protein
MHKLGKINDRQICWIHTSDERGILTNIPWTHCCIHKQTLASKHIPKRLNEVLVNAVKTLYFTKITANSRIFQAIHKKKGQLTQLSVNPVVLSIKQPFTSPDAQKTMPGFRA